MDLLYLKKFIVGEPLTNEEAPRQRLTKLKGLAVFSSDALSSIAYATQEVLIPLAAISTAALSWAMPIAFGIALLIIIVASSYWQTIRSYPRGGGAYLVTKENLGMLPSLVTAASLLIEYTLTVAVSAAAGVAAITSALPGLMPESVVLGCFAILIVTLVNLRGVRESGTFFSIPTYFFMLVFTLLIIVGFGRVAAGSLPQRLPLLHEVYPAIPILFLLRAFSSGCTAMAGIEAISDGVAAFQPPEPRNARITLLWMVIILGSFFIGATTLAHLLGLTPSDNETVLSQLGKTVFGSGFLYYLFQLSTALILFVAANTSFNDFPRVCSFLAKDRFLPRQLASVGDRLVYSKGILLLGAISMGLVIFFGGQVHHLIPLYAIGVFGCFTLSQTGMVINQWRARKPRWILSMSLSLVGAIATLLTTAVLAWTKFLQGAWMVVLFIPVLVIVFRATREHYRNAAAQLALTADIDLRQPIKHVVVLPISGIHKGVIDAVKYAKSLARDVRVVYVELDPEATKRLEKTWNEMNTGLPLVILPSPYRSVIEPILEYIRTVDRIAEDDLLTVVIPEFVTARWWHRLYHNQTALLIKAALLFEPGKVVTSVRYHLE